MGSARMLTPALGVLVAPGLFAPSSPSSASPAARSSTVAKSTKNPPATRKRITLPADVQTRLSAPTVATKPKRFEPLTAKQVRERIATDERPQRPNRKGKLRPISYADLTDELNSVERKLNSYGYSLRDNRKVVYHEHQPDRAKLEQQVERISKVASVKPQRAPMPLEKLRAKVRGSAKPPARRELGPGAATNGMWMQQSPMRQAEADFGWQPSIGEAELASAYVSTRANFSGSIGGLRPGLHGNVVVQAGSYVFGERVDVVRLESTMAATLDGNYAIDVSATTIGGFEFPIYSERKAEPLSASDARDLFVDSISYEVPIAVIGFPVMLEVTVTPRINLGFEATLANGYLVGELQPSIDVKASLEVFVDAYVGQAGAGGEVLLVNASPTLGGAVEYFENNGNTEVGAYVNGWMRLRFLEGRLYLFLVLGRGWLSTTLEHELWDYGGWRYDFPLFKWRSSEM